MGPSVGVLAFIFVDVMEHAFSIVEGSVESYKDDEGSLGRGSDRRFSWAAARSSSKMGTSVERSAAVGWSDPPNSGGDSG